MLSIYHTYILHITPRDIHKFSTLLETSEQLDVNDWRNRGRNIANSEYLIIV